MSRAICVLTVCFLGIFGCSSNPQPSPPETSVDWGPLAVVPRPPIGLEALATGTIRVSDNCVILSVGAASFLPVWPDDSVAWDASRRSITFANRDGSVEEVTDGNMVGLGGGGTDGRAHTLGDGWVSGTAWTNAPHPSCPTDHPWWVNDVRVQ